jgi:hypothetical protein
MNVIHEEKMLKNLIDKILFDELIMDDDDREELFEKNKFQLKEISM